MGNKKFHTLNEEELRDINGGVAPLIIVGGLIATPFILGTIAGAADEFARKKGHR